MSKALIAFDTNRIKQYVFGTDRLKEIRGASGILDDLNRNQMPKVVGGRLIYAHGGSGLFLVERDQAPDKISAVQRMYRERTGGAASIAAAMVDVPADFDPSVSPIVEMWDQLGAMLEVEKQSLPIVSGVVTHPLFRPCASNGATYASVRGSAPDELVSLSTELKREESDRRRQQQRQHGQPEPEHLDALGQTSTPPDYIGLIYADGDGFGKSIRECKTLDALSRFAGELDAALRASISEATAELGAGQKVELLLGGDDLVMLTCAQSTLSVASRVARHFQRKMAAHKLTLSTAVVWAHTKYPFSSLLDLAESGLKFAKRKGAERGKKGLVNFMVVNSANHLDFKEYYNQVLMWRDARATVHRTMRPYTLDNLDALMEQRSRLNNISRSKLEQIRSAIFQPSIQKAMLQGLSVAVNLCKEQRDAVMKAVGEFKSSGIVLFPFIKDSMASTEYYAPLADLVEVWDFIQEKE